MVLWQLSATATSSSAVLRVSAPASFEATIFRHLGQKSSSSLPGHPRTFQTWAAVWSKQCDVLASCQLTHLTWITWKLPIIRHVLMYSFYHFLASFALPYIIAHTCYSTCSTLALQNTFHKTTRSHDPERTCDLYFGPETSHKGSWLAHLSRHFQTKRCQWRVVQLENNYYNVNIYQKNTKYKYSQINIILQNIINGSCIKWQE